MNGKLLLIAWWISFVLLLIGGAAGIIYELLPDKSIVSETCFNAVFYSQFVVIVTFVTFSVFKVKRKK